MIITLLELKGLWCQNERSKNALFFDALKMTFLEGNLLSGIFDTMLIVKERKYLLKIL